jgi:hypothetical protein
MLIDMDRALTRMRDAGVEYSLHSETHLDMFIDACQHCMGVLSSMWLELADRVDSDYRRRK